MSRSQADPPVPRAWSLGLSEDQLAAVWRSSGDQALGCRQLPCTMEGIGSTLERLLAAEPQLSASAARQPVRLTIADELVRWWVVTPPLGLRSLAELRRVAAMRFEELFSDSLEHWQVDARWSARVNTVCCAVPASLEGWLKSDSARSIHILDAVP